MRPFSSASLITLSASSADLANGLSTIAGKYLSILFILFTLMGSLTVLASHKRLLSKRGVSVRVSRDHDQLYLPVGEESLCRAVVADLWEVDCAMGAWLCRRGIGWCLSSLKDRHDLIVGDGGDEGQVEAFGSKAIAYDSDLDRHVDTTCGRAVI